MQIKYEDLIRDLLHKGRRVMVKTQDIFTALSTLKLLGIPYSKVAYNPTWWHDIPSAMENHTEYAGPYPVGLDMPCDKILFTKSPCVVPSKSWSVIVEPMTSPPLYLDLGGAQPVPQEDTIYFLDDPSLYKNKARLLDSKVPKMSDAIRSVSGHCVIDKRFVNERHLFMLSCAASIRLNESALWDGMTPTASSVPSRHTVNAVFDAMRDLRPDGTKTPMASEDWISRRCIANPRSVGAALRFMEFMGAVASKIVDFSKVMIQPHSVPGVPQGYLTARQMEDMLGMNWMDALKKQPEVVWGMDVNRDRMYWLKKNDYRNDDAAFALASRHLIDMSTAIREMANSARWVDNALNISVRAMTNTHDLYVMQGGVCERVGGTTRIQI